MQTLIAALPNITGKITGTYGGYIAQNAAGEGAFGTNGYSGTASFGDGPAPRFYLKFDASQCSTIYRDNCATVQPSAITIIAQIKI